MTGLAHSHCDGRERGRPLAAVLSVAQQIHSLTNRVPISGGGFDCWLFLTHWIAVVSNEFKNRMARRLLKMASVRLTLTKNQENSEMTRKPIIRNRLSKLARLALAGGVEFNWAS